MKRGRTIFAAVFAALVVATACGGAGTQGTTTRPDVIIGSTNFYEQLTLGELYAQILEANGYKVTRKFNLGSREIVQPAIESGQIDIDAEYLATLLAFVDKSGTIAKPSTDPKTTQAGLQKALDPKQLTVLAFAATTSQSTCQKNAVNLEDNKHQQPAHKNAPIVRNDLLQKNDGTLKRLLNSISAKLSQSELNDMNKQVAVDKKDNKDVAAAWLKKQGLIK